MASQKKLREKIRKIKHEKPDMKNDQAVAIAYSMLEKHKKKNKKPMMY